MLGYANYRGHRVQIFEVLLDRNTNTGTVFINFGGPMWVNLQELSEIELINVTMKINKGA